MKHLRLGWPIESCPKAGPERRPRNWPLNWPRCRSSACDQIDCRRCTSGDCRNPMRSMSSSPACTALPLRPGTVPDGSPQVPAATAPRRVSTSAGLIDGVARADVVNFRVTVFVGNRVVESQHRDPALDFVEVDLVVRAADGHRLAAAG